MRKQAYHAPRLVMLGSFLATTNGYIFGRRRDFIGRRFF